VWNIAANHAGNCIAAACEDGTIRLFTVTESGLSYAASMAGHTGTRPSFLLPHAKMPTALCNGHVTVNRTCTVFRMVNG